MRRYLSGAIKRLWSSNSNLQRGQLNASNGTGAETAFCPAFFIIRRKNTRPIIATIKTRMIDTVKPRRSVGTWLLLMDEIRPG